MAKKDQEECIIEKVFDSLFVNLYKNKTGLSAEIIGYFIKWKEKIRMG